MDFQLDDGSRTKATPKRKASLADLQRVADQRKKSRTSTSAKKDVIDKKAL